MRRDSLRKVLPSLKDTARVDCLNELVGECWGLFKDNGDSAYYYAVQANQEAVKIEYKYGEAMSKSSIAEYENYPKNNRTVAETYISQSILIGETIKNDKVLGRAYLALGRILFNSEKRDQVKSLECYKKSQSYFQKAGDKEAELEVTRDMCLNYIDHGKYDEAFDYCDKCVKLTKFITPRSTAWRHELVQWAFVKMGELYYHAGDYQTYIEYLKQADHYGIANELGWTIDIALSDAFSKLGEYDSALFYWHRWEKVRHLKVVQNQAWGDNVLGEIYLKTKRYDEALKLFETGNETFRKGFDQPLSHSLLLTAKVYVEKKQWNTAFKFSTEGLRRAKDQSIPIWMIDGYELLSKINHQLGNDRQAYANLLQYVTLKDSILNRQFLWRLNSYKKTAEEEKKKSEIELLSKDNQIKDEQLKQETLQKRFLAGGLIALIILTVTIFRTIRLRHKNEILNRDRLENEMKMQQLENQKHEAELRQQASELEMQALRAQMNPHFIFNCLSSINHFILKNESEAASDYLTRFSRLIRFVLVNSKQSLISLEDELETIRLYIEMERLRFKNSFDFSISFKNEIDVAAIAIPPLLLQPFVENAIWHGLMNKEGRGQIDILFMSDIDLLTCTIMDNGVGRRKAEEMKGTKDVKRKSMGLQLTRERLANLNKQYNTDASFEMEDLYDVDGQDSGTKVVLKIRLESGIGNLADQYSYVN